MPSDGVVIGIVLGLVFAAVSYYLYSRIGQLERKVGLMENILLDLKVTTEQALISATEPEQVQQRNVFVPTPVTEEESQPTEDERTVNVEKPSRTPVSKQRVQVERSSVGANYEAMTYKELVALAKQNGVSGIRNLSKAQLIDALRRRNGGVSSTDESKQTELSSWTAASGTVSFTEKQEEVELAGAQEEDHQLLSSVEQFESSMDQLDQLTSFVQ